MSNKITNISELKKTGQGQVVQLPGWGDEPFFARLKRPSMLGLASKGKIPNALLGAAQKIFSSGMSDQVDILEVYELARIMADEALAEPTMADLEEAGLELTDEQLMAVMSYTQVGARGLERFRSEPADNKGNQSK